MGLFSFLFGHNKNKTNKAKKTTKSVAKTAKVVVKPEIVAVISAAIAAQLNTKVVPCFRITHVSEIWKQSGREEMMRTHD